MSAYLLRHPDHWAQLQQACMHLGDYRPALAACDRFLQRDPYQATVYFHRARLHGFLGLRMVSVHSTAPHFTADTSACKAPRAAPANSPLS